MCIRDSGGNALAETQVFGMRAGSSAGAAPVCDIHPGIEQISTATSMLEGFLSGDVLPDTCLLYTSPSPRDRTRSRMPSSA